MTKPIKWGLAAAAVAVLFLLLVVWGVQRYQDRLERETHAPERLQQRLMAVQVGEGMLVAEDLEETELREQEHARIRQLLARDLSRTPHPNPDQALALLTPGAVSLVASQEGLLAALTRRLVALPKTDWQRTVVAADHWELAVGDTCLTVRNRDSTGVDWRWTSISRCSAD